MLINLGDTVVSLNIFELVILCIPKMFGEKVSNQKTKNIEKLMEYKWNISRFLNSQTHFKDSNICKPFGTNIKYGMSLII